MSPDQILEHFRQEPFEPLRICLSDGSSYEVRHPEFAAITRRVVVIGVPSDAELPERTVYCDPLHITRIDILDAG